jgi:Protein of unknown function (DUF938)
MDPSFGLRDLEQVMELARENELDFEERIEMPANNLCILFRKR